MRAYERFLQYIQFDTTSDETCERCPSSESQRVFGKRLVAEMQQMGIADARIDEDGYVYGSIPANCPDQPSIGLIAHMDTVDEAPALPMNARIIHGYDGGDVALNDDGRSVLSPCLFPPLKQVAGEDLIVTDGRTLLGADDKAGVAEILTLCERLLADDSIRHGKICIGFTPDEEIGRGADRFDVAGFGADFAYTVDGGELPWIEYENFNAASAAIQINGLSVHPGGAKGKMKNALLMALELAQMMPATEIPACTEGYEGFYHLNDMSGGVEPAQMNYIIRDHDRQKFEARKAYIRRVVHYLNEKHGAGSFVLELKDSYYNMKEMLLEHMDVVDRAMDAFRALGYEPGALPIRGGTDGARLSYMGLPCPNLPTGGMNCHGRFECITIQSMDQVVEALVHLVRAR